MKYPKVSRILGTLFDRLLDVCASIAGLSIISIMLLTGYQVAGRYFFNSSPSWITEMVNMLLLYMTFLGAPWILKMRGHIVIDVICAHLSKKPKYILSFITTIIGIITCLILAWYSIETVNDSIRNGIMVSTTFKVSRGMVISAIPIGFILLFIEFIRQFVGYIINFKTPTN